MKRSGWTLRIVESTAVLLFWLQAARVLFSMLFGLTYDAIFDAELSLGVVALVFLSVIVALVLPAFPIFSRIEGKKKEGGLFLAALVASAARIPLTMDEPRLRLGGSIVVMGAAGVYLFLLARNRGAQATVALALALIGDQLARIFGDTWDYTLQTAFLPFQIVFSLVLIGLSWTLRAQENAGDSDTSRELSLGGGLALGAFLFLESAVLAQPNVLARWSGVGYSWVAPALMMISALPLFCIAGWNWSGYGGKPLQWFAGQGVVVRGGVFLIGGSLGMFLGCQVDGIVGLLMLLVAQVILLLVLPLIPIWQPVGVNNRRRPGGLALALGMFFFLVLNLLHTFAFTYPYTIVAFRDAGIIILLVAFVVAVLPAVFKPPEAIVTGPTRLNNHLIALFVFVLLMASFWVNRPTLQIQAPTHSFRIATYNIHYGYDTDWRHSLEAQAQAIEQSRADVVFLQEVDAGRITSYGVDNALWLARRLGMQAVFAPALEGLSGVALLTRLPILATDWSLLPSELEQTAIVHARIEILRGYLDAYGVWLGLEEEERMNQLEAALAFVGNGDCSVLGGDMNADPDSPVYRLIRDAGYSDPFVATDNLPALTDPSINPKRRIDYIWARGLEPQGGWVLPSLASDHRLVVAEFTLP